MRSPRRDHRRYRIDFALIVLTGNMTRYLYVRPAVEEDSTVAARWIPIRSWEERDWLRVFPGGIRLRARHLLDSRKLFLRRPADAVVIHALETYGLYGIWHRLLRLRTVIVCNPDGGFDPQSAIGRWMLERAIDRTSLFVPFSNWTADHMLATHPRIADRIRVVPPGLPLDKWPQRDRPPPAERFRLLFVGGDAPRKGLGTLLDAFEQELHDTCDLFVATQSAYLTPELRAQLGRLPQVHVHLDLAPASDQLQRLFREADAFVLPTKGEVLPWVAQEALATGVPTVITDVGGVSDIVKHDETGLIISPDDVAQLVAAVRRLETDPELAQRLVQRGRRHIEESFDVRVNTERLLDMTKELIDQRG